MMKALITAVFALAAAVVAAAAPAPSARVAHPDHGVGQTLQDYQRQERDAPPRHLSEAERAELRRLLNEYGRTPARATVQPETR